MSDLLVDLAGAVQVAVGVYPDGQIKYKCLSRGYTAWWQRKTYFTFLTSYILVVPAFVICFCYSNVVRVVWQQGKEVSTKKGIELRKTIKNERFLIRAKIKTVKVCDTIRYICTCEAADSIPIQLLVILFWN